MRALLRTNKNSGKNEYQFFWHLLALDQHPESSHHCYYYLKKNALHEAESILYYKNYGKWMNDPNEENK